MDWSQLLDIHEIEILRLYPTIKLLTYKNVHSLPTLPPTKENSAFAMSVLTLLPLSAGISVFASQFLAFET